MKKNEFDIFNDPDDEIINEIAANYPVLTDKEKERMFSMSERKYNINNNENGDEVSGVDRYTRPVWHRYAAIAATFVLLAGGIGGSIALGKHMNKNKNSDHNSIHCYGCSRDHNRVSYSNKCSDSHRDCNN